MQTANKHIIDLKGTPYMTYDGLVALSKERFIKSFTSCIMQLPTAENNQQAIVEATLVALEMFHDQVIEVTFTGIGDASLANCSRLVSNHTLRMADTRARARALRDYLGVAIIEESDDQHTPENSTITIDQRQRISQLFNEKAIPKEERKQFSKEITGIADFKSYDYETANQLIEALQKYTSA